MPNAESNASMRGNRRRERTMVACMTCKRRKQKCDGQSPSCGQCLRAERECLVEDPVTKQQQPRAYQQLLEERVAELENMVRDIRAGASHGHPQQHHPVLTMQVSGLPDTPEIAPVANAVPGQSASHSDNVGRLNDAENSNSLMYSATNTRTNRVARQSRYLEPSSVLVTSSLQRVQLQGPGISMGGISDPLLIGQLPAIPCSLPSAGVGAVLMRAYFDEVHPQYPILHKDTVVGWQEAVLQSNASDGVESKDPVMLYFLNMVYAISSLILQYNGEGSARGFHAAAQQYQDYVIQQNNVESIQAILCYALYSLYSPVGVSIWSLSGLALRQCLELGYHRKHRAFYHEDDPLQLELQKRVFWCSYNLDRAAAVTLGRPFGVRDEDIDVEFPLDIDDHLITSTMIYDQPRIDPSEPTTAMSAAIHTFRLRRIWSKIYYAYYSISPDTGGESSLAQYFRAELDEWYASIPSLSQSSSTRLSVFGSRDWFQLAFSHSILLLYCPQIMRKQNPGVSRATSMASYTECFGASQKICELYRRIFIANASSCSWGSLHILFFAGLTFIFCLWSSPETRRDISYHDVYRTCTSCTVVLSLMAERWKAAAPHRDFFDVLANRTVNVVCNKDFKGWSEDEDVSTGDVEDIQDTGPEPLMRDWIIQIAQSGMSMAVELLLTEFSNRGFLRSSAID